MTKGTISIRTVIAICVSLVALVWIVFGQTLGHKFVNFDDGTEVMRGISVEGIRWAFTHSVAANWHPFTILSHMIDCQFFGTSPAGHHFTNVALHAVATVLLFLVLCWMTQALWRSALVATVFGIHPLHVESVAWIAERKDVLSAVFFMLTLMAYVAYARKQSVGRYVTMSIFYVCGLMSKSMLVTLPFLLLLLDYWPLNRLERSTIGKLILEKVPLFIFSAAACVETLISQHTSINIIATASLGARIANAFLAMTIYIRQTVWPASLAVFYAYPEGNISWLKVLVAVGLLTGISAAAFALRKKAPYFLIGWLWYVGMLVPVLGIVQVGAQAHADRYTYLPQIGLVLIAVWMVADISRRWAYRQITLIFLALAVIGPMTWAARRQTSHWYDSQTLWEHTVSIAPDNETARVHLSDAYLQNERIDDALAQAREAVGANANSAEGHGVLGAALAKKGLLDDAIKHLQRAAELDADLPRVYYNLGNVFLGRGDLDNAIVNYEKELRVGNLPEAHNNLALALLRKRQVTAAIDHLNSALDLKPDYSDARNNLATALSQTGNMHEAIAQWQKTLEFQPDNLQAECNLAWIYSTFPESSVRDGGKAIELAQRAIQLSGGNNARIWRLGAAAYAEAGQFPEAIKAAQTGLALAEAEGDSALSRTFEANIKRFEQQSPLRDTGAAGSSR